MSILDRRAVIVVGHIYYIKQKKKNEGNMYVFLKEKLLLFKQKR